MDEIKLTPRLRITANLAKGAGILADIGTDHGYLALWFAKSGAAEIYAADVRPGPLARARQNAEKYGLTERVGFVLADGLDFPGAERADTVVMAGMGGESVIAILAAAPWTKNGTRLVIQPQTKADELCLWLRDNGYALTDAALAREGGRLYVAFSAVSGASGAVYPEELLVKKRDPLILDWLALRISRIEKALSAAESSGRAGDRSAEAATLTRLKKLLEAAYYD